MKSHFLFIIIFGGDVALKRAFGHNNGSNAKTVRELVSRNEFVV